MIARFGGAVTPKKAETAITELKRYTANRPEITKKRESRWGGRL